MTLQGQPVLVGEAPCILKANLKRANAVVHLLHVPTKAELREVDIAS